MYGDVLIVLNRTLFYFHTWKASALTTTLSLLPSLISLYPFLQLYFQFPAKFHFPRTSLSSVEISTLIADTFREAGVSIRDDLRLSNTTGILQKKSSQVSYSIP